MIQKIITDPLKFYLLLALLALCLAYPSVPTGLHIDDFYHRLIMLDLIEPAEEARDASLYKMFAFLDGRPERTNYLINHGVLPWWTFPEVKYTFFRPLSELTIALDYKLWPDNFRLMHWHSSFWFMASVLACALLFRSVSANKTLALLPIAFFLLDGSHSLTIAWLSARNGLIAATFSALAVYFYFRFSQTRSPTPYFFALLSLLLSMTAGEIGVTACAFVVAYAAFLETAPWLKRAAYLTPFVVLTLSWMALRSYLGFGTYGSDAYFDPFSNTWLFVENVLKSANLIWLTLWAGVPVELAVYLKPEKNPGLPIFYALFNLFLLVLYFPFWKNNARAKFYFAAMLMATVPILAGVPQSRVMIIVSIPALAFVAECLLSYWQERKSIFTNTLAHTLWQGLLLLASSLALVSHLVIAPIVLLATQPILDETLEPILNDPVAALELPEDIEEKTLVLINPPVATIIGYMPMIRRIEGQPNAKNSFILSSGLHGVDIERRDANTLIVSPTGGYLREPIERIMRAKKFSLQAGDVVELEGLSVTILSLNKFNLPESASFRFDEPLESKNYLFKVWSNQNPEGVFVDYIIPEIDEIQHISPAKPGKT